MIDIRGDLPDIRQVDAIGAGAARTHPGQVRTIDVRQPAIRFYPIDQHPGITSGRHDLGVCLPVRQHDRGGLLQRDCRSRALACLVRRSFIAAAKHRADHGDRECSAPGG